MDTAELHVSCVMQLVDTSDNTSVADKVEVAIVSKASDDWGNAGIKFTPISSVLVSVSKFTTFIHNKEQFIHCHSKRIRTKELETTKTNVCTNIKENEATSDLSLTITG